MRLFVVLASAGLAACGGEVPEAAPESLAIHAPGEGVNLVLEGPIEAASGHQLVMGDLVLAAGAEVPPHIHSGEEFLYVLGGSATIIREGLPDVTLEAGQALRIPPGLVHSGLAGPDGVRATASWIVVDGQPLRSPPPG